MELKPDKIKVTIRVPKVPSYIPVYLSKNASKKISTHSVDAKCKVCINNAMGSYGTIMASTLAITVMATQYVNRNKDFAKSVSFFLAL